MWSFQGNDVPFLPNYISLFLLSTFGFLMFLLAFPVDVKKRCRRGKCGCNLKELEYNQKEWSFSNESRVVCCSERSRCLWCFSSVGLSAFHFVFSNWKRCHLRILILCLKESLSCFEVIVKCWSISFAVSPWKESVALYSTPQNLSCYFYQRSHHQ